MQVWRTKRRRVRKRLRGVKDSEAMVELHVVVMGGLP